MSDLLTINGLSVTSRSHVCEDISGVYAPPQPRGQTRVVPGQPGELPRRLQPGAARFSLPVVVFGDCEPDGTPYADVREGLRVNLDLVRQAASPASSAPWTVTATHTLPDGATRTAQVQVVSVEGPVPIGPSAARVVLDVVVPSGTWTYTAAGS